MIKVMKKVDKIKEEEIKHFQPKFDSYKESKEFKDLEEVLKSRDEEDDYRNDYDPKGYDLYLRCVRLYLSWLTLSVEGPGCQGSRVCRISSWSEPRCQRIISQSSSYILEER